MDPHQIKLMQAAPALGISTQDLSDTWNLDLVAYTRDSRTLHIIKGRIYPNLSHSANLIADNKLACKQLLRHLAVPTPPSLLIDERDQQHPAIVSFLNQYTKVACKPVVGTNGIGIGLGLERLDDVLQHLENRPGHSFFLEQLAPGQDLRLQAVGGRLLAACMRTPTTLIGDGVTSVRGLIDARNAVIRRQNPLNHVTVDDEMLDLLHQMGLHLDAVPQARRALQIKKTANMAQGATAVDVTDQVHQDYAACIERVAKALDMTIFAMDFMTTDHRKPLVGHGMALEINARPAWMHHTFSERRTHDMPTLILQELFDENRR